MSGHDPFWKGPGVYRINWRFGQQADNFERPLSSHEEWDSLWQDLRRRGYEVMGVRMTGDLPPAQRKRPQPPGKRYGPEVVEMFETDPYAYRGKGQGEREAWYYVVYWDGARWRKFAHQGNNVDPERTLWDRSRQGSRAYPITALIVVSKKKPPHLSTIYMRVPNELPNMEDHWDDSHEYDHGEEHVYKFKNCAEAMPYLAANGFGGVHCDLTRDEIEDIIAGDFGQ